MAIMLDLETLGTVITQIGAVYFDWTGRTGKTFLVNVNIKSCLDAGLEIHWKEFKFWLENRDKISWDKNTIPLTKALQFLTEFCNKEKRSQVWSHYYDIMILETACRKLKQKLPFSYKRWKDIRTLVYLAYGEDHRPLPGQRRNSGRVEKEKTHNALDDCLYQVDYCIGAFQKLEER